MKYAEYKDSKTPWMGAVPSHWTLERAKWSFALRNERGNDTPVLLAATQKYGMYPQDLIEGVVKVAEGTDVQQFRTVHKGDFVISLRSFQGGFERSDYEGVCSPAYQVFFANDTWNTDYLKYLFKNELFVDAMNSLTVGIREGRNIKYEDFANSILAIPPISEQEAIAAFLDEKIVNIDSVIAEAKASIEEYKSWKASIIYEAVTKGLDPNVEMKDSGVEWIGMMPTNWQCLRFKFATNIKANLVDPQDYPDYPQVAPDNIVKDAGILLPCNSVSESGVISWNHLFYKGQILYSKIRPTLNKAVIAPFDGLCSADMYPIETTQNTMFMLYVILSKYFVQQVALCTADRVKMPKINQEELANIQIALPHIVEQEIIANHLNVQCARFDSLISEKEALISDLEAYKKSLIFEVVTGKRKVV